MGKGQFSGPVTVSSASAISRSSVMEVADHFGIKTRLIDLTPVRAAEIEGLKAVTGLTDMPNQKVLVLDFGGQYNQLIARRVRECSVYCEVHPYTMTLEAIRAYAPIGIIFTGGPNSVYTEGSPQVDPAVFQLGVPILGICYGCQLLAHHLGGRVTEAQDDSAREYGKTRTYFDTACRLYKGLPAQGVTWMSHE